MSDVVHKKESLNGTSILDFGSKEIKDYYRDSAVSIQKSNTLTLSQTKDMIDVLNLISLSIIVEDLIQHASILVIVLSFYFPDFIFFSL